MERRFYLGGSYIAHQALLAGRIDTYVEYTGTALSAILKQPPPPDPGSVFRIVQKEYRARYQLDVLPPLGFNNSFAMIMRPEDAARLEARTLSALARSAVRFRLGVGYEFLDRLDGLPGLVRTYGLRFSGPPQVMDLALLYRALESKQVDIIAGSNTDGLIEALGLAVLEDDLHYFAPYDAVPIVRAAALPAFPRLRPALMGLCGRISAAAMRRLNYAVEGEKRDPETVVRAFLPTIRTSDLNSKGVIETGPSVLLPKGKQFPL